MSALGSTPSTQVGWGVFPQAARWRILFARPDHPKSGLLGFRVSTPQPPYQGGLLFLAARQTSNYRKRERKTCASVVAQSDYKNFAKASLRQMYADPGIAALARFNTSARTDCGPLIAAIAARRGETHVANFLKTDFLEKSSWGSLEASKKPRGWQEARKRPARSQEEAPHGGDPTKHGNH